MEEDRRFQIGVAAFGLVVAGLLAVAVLYPLPQYACQSGGPPLPFGTSSTPGALTHAIDARQTALTAATALMPAWLALLIACRYRLNWRWKSIAITSTTAFLPVWAFAWLAAHPCSLM